ncbi:MAG: hypothetical protein Q9196_002718 [Gyalolechia fulgens]
MMRQSSAELSDTPLPQFQGGRHGKSARGSEKAVKWRQFQGNTKPKPGPYRLEIDELEALGTQVTAELSEAVRRGQFKPIVYEDGEESTRPTSLSVVDARCSTRDDNERNQYLAVSTGLLRNIPDDIIFIAGDRDDNILVYLDLIAVSLGFGNEVKARMERESIYYFSLKKPELSKRDVRQTSQQRHRERKWFSEDQCGVDHRASSSVFSILNSGKSTATSTRPAPSSQLPPTSPDWRPETYTYRLMAVNMQTDYHVDETD